MKTTKKRRAFTPQKIDAMGRKLHKLISEIQSEAEQSLNDAKRKMQRGLCSAEDFDAFQMRLEEWRDLQIEELRDEHRAKLREDMMVETYWKVAKVPTATTEVESVDNEVRKVMGWPWTEDDLKAKECRDLAQRESDKQAERLLASISSME